MKIIDFWREGSYFSSLVMRMEQTPGSSHIAAIGHDRVTRVLDVNFRDGSRYSYLAVPEGTYQRIRGAKSVGQMFHQLIPGRFKSVKVRPATPKKGPPV